MANFLGRLQTLLFGAAVGRAASESVTPVLEPVRQHAWQKNQLRVLDPNTAAEARAKGIISEQDGEDDASRSGVSVGRFGALLRLAQSYPGTAELGKMSNRNEIGPDLVSEALTRHGIPEKYHKAFTDLFAELLTPGELAAAIHRGLVPAQGLVLGEQPQGPFNVDAYPVQDINAIEEAAGSGYDRKRLHTLVGLQGLPMGPHEAAQAFFRDIITHGDYIRAFNTSNMRNEWAQAILDQSRQIPTARDFFENALRGYHDLAWAQKEAERHGMSHADSLVIYQNQGRPMPVKSITQALARGGKFKPEPGELTDPFEASIVEGNLKPAYYDLAKALRYTLPSYFVVKAMLAAKAITQAEAEQIFLEEGWRPDLAKKAAAALAPATGAADSPFVGRAQTQLWTATHKAFVGGDIDAATADSYLSNLIDSPADRAVVMQLWETEANLAGRSGPPA